jgi:hypothetical protein
VYVNRAYATVVARSAFAGARPAQAAMVRDAGIVRQLQGSPVTRGPLPVLPTRESLRQTTAAGPRPPAAVLARPVSARLAPPPAPPAFDRKVEVIRESRGAPLTPEAASRLAVQSGPGARAAVVIRPVVRPDRRVDFAPHKDAVGAPPPDPIRAGERTLAAPETPLIPHPSAARENVPPARVAPGAVVLPAPRQARPAPPQAAAAPPSRQAAAPAPEPRQQPQPQPFSRPPRRVVEPGPDPIAHEAAPVRPEARPEPRQEAKPQERPQQRAAPARGNEAPRNEQQQEKKDKKD